MIGAEWVKETADINFRLLDPSTSYSARTFGISTHGSVAHKSINPSVLARVRNSLFHAFNKADRLPDIVVVVLEDDVINSTGFIDDDLLLKDYSRRIKWLMSEYRKAIEGVKDVLPPNAKSDKKPKFLWIMPTRHVNYANNFYRKKFANAMETMAKFYENTTALRLVQRWDFNDTNLYLKEERRFTYDGKAEFWKAVDKTVEYFDTKYEKKKQEPKDSTVLTLPRPPQPENFNNRGNQPQNRREFHSNYSRHDRPRFNRY